MTAPRVPGVLVGHWTDLVAGTGCTAILLPAGSTGGVAVPGRAPATRETDALVPGRRVKQIHGVSLSGGSAFGLDAAGGVMRVLEARGFGHPTPAGAVPIVPAASIFDLVVGDASRRPGVEEGAAAALAATDDVRAEGLVGAATGATCGKYAGFETMTKTGFGVAAVGDGEIVVEAFAVCNAVGDIVADDGSVLAGARVADPAARRAELLEAGEDAFVVRPEIEGTMTTIACIVTNAVLDGAACTAVAGRAAVAAFGRALDPPGTLWDGDALFVCATNTTAAPAGGSLEDLATEALVRAIRRCAATGAPLHGIPSAS